MSMKQRIGIVGGGQLGRMLGFAAKRLGFTVTVIDPTPGSPAGQVVDRQIVADYKDEAAIRALAEVSDFLTFEIELANAAILDELAGRGIVVNPSAKTLGIIKDKYRQKQFLKKAGLPVARFVPVESAADIARAGKRFGYPLLLKARFDAYDGRGNAVIRSAADIPDGMHKLSGRELYVEQFVPFVKELAVMVARNTAGDIRAYPVVETVHRHNICHTVYAPAPVSPTAARRARRLATAVLRHLNGAGVFGIELFLTASGRVLINEIAPRVHNSGHYTIEACITDQFEQHIRAVTGLPLGSTAMTVPAAVMVNILGDRTAPAAIGGYERALAIPGVSVHIYGKADTKVERKMGHVTAVDMTLTKAYNKARRARKAVTI